MDGVSRLRRWRLVVGGIVVAALVLSSVSIAMGASSPFQNVIIGNTAASPVPVTGTVNVGNLPTTQVVSGTVNVGGAVNVGNWPATQSVSGTVNVGNLPAIQPMQESILWDDWGDASYLNFNFDEIDIPPGKMLVLQTVNFSAFVKAGQQVRATLFTQASGGGNAIWDVALVKAGTFDGLDFYAGTEAITGYSDGASGVRATLIRSSTDGVGDEVRVSFSGYLVALPLP